MRNTLISEVRSARVTHRRVLTAAADAILLANDYDRDGRRLARPLPLLTETFVCPPLGYVAPPVGYVGR